MGLAPTESQLSLLGRYAKALRERNRQVNLVSRKDVGRILSYHVLDSLAAASLVPTDSRVVDIGTGAGLPGIPLAICRPDVTLFLVESIAKKARFLEHAVAELGLTNVHVIHARAEAIEPLSCRVALSRLTGELTVCLGWLARHCATDGSIVLWKSPGTAGADAQLLSRHGVRVQEARDIVLPVTGIPRRFVVLVRQI
ncbi:MAG: 16S rRNA (guanine(527)-N(7))-methyltransferase RsmG [candidate division WOR-3 bacterium]|nr:MAG: 16S rRNA (guanine(527)-N(7))-methyltransferase RsmG [candidate division WOR-3 bacterium]